MAQDAELIAQAYESTVKSLFGVFFSNRVSAKAAKDPNAALLEAEHAFQKGMAAAREARDRAIQLLPPDD